MFLQTVSRTRYKQMVFDTVVQDAIYFIHFLSRICICNVNLTRIAETVKSITLLKLTASDIIDIDMP